MDRSRTFVVLALALVLAIACAAQDIAPTSRSSSLGPISPCKAEPGSGSRVVDANPHALPCAAGMDFAAIALECAPLVPTRTARAVVAVESGFQPLAIHVNGGLLARQPVSEIEAVATAKALRSRGWDFDMGLAQINVRTAQRLGMPIDQAFDPCVSLRAMQRVLQECLVLSQRGGHDARAGLLGALSCFNTGNASSGLRNGYVARVIAAAGDGHGDR